MTSFAVVCGAVLAGASIAPDAWCPSPEHEVQALHKRDGYRSPRGEHKRIHGIAGRSSCDAAKSLLLLRADGKHLQAGLRT